MPMDIQLFEATPVIHALGRALVHFLWQGALLALLAAGALRLLAREAPQVRYVVACCAMVAMLAVPVFTGVVSYASGSGVATDTAARALSPLGVAGGATAAAPAVGPAAGSGPASWPRLVSAAVRAETFLPWVVLVWLAALLALSARALAGVYGVHTLRRSAMPADPAWQRRVDELAGRLGIDQVVGLLEAARVQVPAVVGWLRPVILVPATAMTGLSPRQLELILLHELAHIRRHDYLLNLLQVVAETVLFYSPAVWWLSARIREEREHCCDDVAVAASGEASMYARALIELEELRHAPPRVAIAVSGGSLLGRVRRLLGSPEAASPGGRWLAGMIALALLGYGAALHARVAPVTAGDGTAALAPAVGVGQAASRSETVLAMVGMGEHGISLTAAIVDALAAHAVTAVYTTSDRHTLDMARPLADGLGVPRIPYDFGLTDSERFARNLLGPSGLERVPGSTAVLVLPPRPMLAVLRYAGVAGAAAAHLGHNEILLIAGPPGEPTITRVRLD
jgi:beta-lactamase regulating signal transducer with metallopeptidase domain